MIFSNKDIKLEKSGCMICDDLFGADEKPIAKESLEKIPIPQRGKVTNGTFGTFDIKDFERITERLKDV